MGQAQNAVQPSLLSSGSNEWKQEASERLRAHRSRRGQPEVENHAALEAVPRTGRKARIAQQVLERYARATSYAKYLDDIAADHGAETDALPEFQPEEPALFAEPVAPLHVPPAMFHAPVIQEPAQAPAPISVTIALPPELPRSTAVPVIQNRNIAPAHPHAPVEWMAATLREPQETIPANLIEFPRELVSSRKARPRRADGPLREPGTELPLDPSQLRIFEVEPEEISIEPLAAARVETPDWHHIRLDEAAAPPMRVSAADARATVNQERLPVAPLRRRTLAALVDTSLIALGYFAFVAAFAAVTPSLPGGRAGIISAAAVLAVCFAGYHWMFANYGSATPGMRYARIALCTFNDSNPTRSQTRRRLAAFFLSLLTLGLGLLWGFVDDDRLGWHDRISRTFQRAY